MDKRYILGFFSGKARERLPVFKNEISNFDISRYFHTPEEYLDHAGSLKQ